MKRNEDISQEEFERIENYLNNELTPDEKITFEKAIQEDPSVGKKVAEVKQLLFGIETAVLKNDLDTYHEELNPVRKVHTEHSDTIEIPKKTNTMALVYSMAAAIVIAFGIFWFMKDLNTPERVFAKHFKPDPGLPTVMSTTNDYSFYEGMVDYKRKEYGVAITKWKKLLPEKENNDTLDYFLGVAYLAEGNAEKSLEYLEPTQKFSNGIFKEDAPYYKALAKIKLGQIEEATKLLKAYPSTRNKELLNDLNK
ncbi:tetratricopeptide repeat protein [Rasiella sp. SM2506]|uniref:tetratricopeptide repeat protein n=1 Tax=Rasiella sp. SM2506 TaxID=3423914 RepID=UPI003D79D3BE